MPPESLRERIASLWGEESVSRGGLLHVVAVSRTEDGGFGVIRIGADSPRSETDFFSLSLARARADAILTTGSILRAEPELSHDPGPELRAWRREVLEKKDPAVVAVLTRGTGLPRDHSVLASPGVLVATSSTGAADLMHGALPPGASLLELSHASLRGLVATLDERGLSTLCVEAGPSTVRELYEEPVLVDELLLSIFEEHVLPESLIAGDFHAASWLRHAFGEPVRDVERREESGRWRFQRFLRSPATK